MITIDKITIAAGRIMETVRFYANTFSIEIKETPAYGTMLYKGVVGNVELLFCPKEFAGISANENTIQLRFSVKNAEELYKNALKNGGTEITPVKQVLDVKIASFRDPDGNSIEVIEKLNNLK